MGTERYSGKITKLEVGKTPQGRTYISEGSILVDGSNESVYFDGKSCQGVRVNIGDIVEFDMGTTVYGKKAFDMKLLKEVAVGQITDLKIGENTQGRTFIVEGSILIDGTNESVFFDGKSCQRTFVKVGDTVKFTIGTTDYGKKAFDIEVLRWGTDEIKMSFKDYEKLYANGEYEQILRISAKNDDLLILLYNEPQFILNTLAMFLNDDLANVKMNQFQETLMRAKTVDEIISLKKESWSYKQCYNTAFKSIDENLFNSIKCYNSSGISFENKCAHFLNFYNSLTFYIFILWIIAKGESKSGIEAFRKFFKKSIEEENNTIFAKNYLTILKIYNTYVTGDDAHVKKDSFYHMIIAFCIDYKNKDVLLNLLDFGTENNLGMSKNLKTLFSINSLTLDDLITFVNKDNLNSSTELCGNVINYLWSENPKKDCFIELVLYLVNKQKISSEALVSSYNRLLKHVVFHETHDDFNSKIKKRLLNKFAEQHPDKAEEIISLFKIDRRKEEYEETEKILEEIKNCIGNPAEKSQIRKNICNYFNLCGNVYNNDYKIFNYFEFDIIEDILLDGYNCKAVGDILASLALIYLYFSKKEWLKAAYIYVVSKQARESDKIYDFEEITKYFIEELNIKNSTYKYKKIDNINQKDILKIALQVLSCDNFDNFINWAKRISYKDDNPDIKIGKKSVFDFELWQLLKCESSSYEACWELIAEKAINGSNEKSDNLRWSIIASYFFRYGEEKYENLVKAKANKDVLGRIYNDFYTSLWRNLPYGVYGQNFLSLNAGMIKNAPVTYWNLFYDYAVCKNHVFSSYSFWGEQWCKTSCDMQAFYDALLERYNCQRETVFLKIAASLLSENEGVLIPRFDYYFTYCNGIKSKDFILRMIVKLIQKNKCIEDVKDFLESSTWNCNYNEKELILTLSSFIKEDEQGAHLHDSFSLEYEKFKYDYLKIFEKYPDLNNIYEVIGKNQPSEYTYRLTKSVFEIIFDNNVFKKLILSSLNADNLKLSEQESTINSYIEMMLTVYKKQLQTPISNGEGQYLLYVQNRYHRILACEILLNQKGIDDIKNDLSELIESNRHKAFVKANYNNFEKALFEFVETCANPENTRIVLKAIATSKWGEFSNNILLYSDEALRVLGKVMSYTRFQEFNKNLLNLFIKTCNNKYYYESNSDLFQKVSHCSELVGKIINQLSENDCDKTEKVVNICQLYNLNDAKAYESVVQFDACLKDVENNLADEQTVYDLYLSALRASTYDDTVVTVYRNRLLKMREPLSALWKDVFKHLNRLNIYYYIQAVLKAWKSNKMDAKNDYNILKCYLF